MLDVDDLELESVAFELRFNNAYRLWDTSGLIWSEIASKHPELSVTNVQPNQQLFDTPNLQMSLELGLFRVISRGSDALDRVATISTDLYLALERHLGLTSFSRAGFRVVRSRSFETATEAISYCEGDRSDSQRPIKGLGPRVGFSSGNRYEGESSGLFATLKVEERNITINIPWEAIPYLAPVKKKLTFVVADVDYYTIGTIDRETLDVATWQNQANKAIRRYWEAL
jgi:hypothetical protein